MYTGTVIDELFAAVDRAEARTRPTSDVEELENWYTASHLQAMPAEPALLGVA